jgi:hypothetical protein
MAAVPVHLLLDQGFHGSDRAGDAHPGKHGAIQGHAAGAAPGRRGPRRRTGQACPGVAEVWPCRRGWPLDGVTEWSPV